MVGFDTIAIVALVLVVICTVVSGVLFSIAYRNSISLGISPSQYMLVEHDYVKEVISRRDGVTKVLTVDDDVVELFDVIKPSLNYIYSLKTEFPNPPIRSYVNWALQEMGEEVLPYGGTYDPNKVHIAHKYMLDTLEDD